MRYQDSLDAWDDAIAEIDKRAEEVERRAHDAAIERRARESERDRMRRDMAPPAPMDGSVLLRVSISSDGRQWTLDHRVVPDMLRHMRHDPARFLVEKIGRMGAESVSGWIAKGAPEHWRQGRTPW